MTAIDTRDPALPSAAGPAQVELILSRIESLPTLPAVATRLLELTTDDDYRTGDVVSLIESDPSLSAKMLSMARRAELGLRVDTVERAVVLLGIEAVRNLVFSIQVFETFSQRVEHASTRFDRVGFWKHSLAVGCAARLLAERLAHSAAHRSVQIPRPEETFVCGLLHDIGKVALDACFPKSYDRVVARVDDMHGCIADVERELFGLDHTLAGRRLAANWKLPAMIGECIWLHHHTPASTPTKIAHPVHVRIVQLADRLARHLRIGYSGNFTPEGSITAMADEMGVASPILEQVLAELPGMIERRAELIGLDRLTSDEVCREAIAAAGGELARVNAALSSSNRQLTQRSLCFEGLRAMNTALGEDSRHEEVCRAGVSAMQRVLPGRPIAVCGFSRIRAVTVLAANRGHDQPVQVELWPGPSAEERPAWLDGVAAWGDSVKLPTVMLDWLASMLDATPTTCRPIVHHGEAVGCVATVGDLPSQTDESIHALSAALGVWLTAAESHVTAQQLNEELVEMNRRLVASQSELARMRSLAMVGAMAAGAAHELNNPLAVISGRGQLLLRDAADESVRRSVQLIVEHAQLASEMVSGLMEFAKPAAPNCQPLPLAELLGDIRARWIERGVLFSEQFRLDLSDESLEVHADAAQTRTLFDEVIDNAVEAMRDTDAPMLIINCRGELTDEKLVIKIEDNGCGMSSEVMEQAMTPFFSHRPAGRGRGLGLSRAARYAEINGGRIRLAPGRPGGTVVFIELPAASDD